MVKFQATIPFGSIRIRGQTRYPLKDLEDIFPMMPRLLPDSNRAKSNCYFNFLSSDNHIFWVDWNQTADEASLKRCLQDLSNDILFPSKFETSQKLLSFEFFSES